MSRDKKVQVGLTKEAYEWVKTEASRMGMSMSTLLALALSEYRLAKCEEKEGKVKAYG